MSDLGWASGYQPKNGPRNRAQASGTRYQNEASTQTQRKGPPDKEACPPGWDAHIWHLALLFRQRALADGIELRAGIHLIYAEIADLVKRYRIEDRSFHHEPGCKRRSMDPGLADHCWYHYPPDKPAETWPAVKITWWRVVEIIIWEFWSRIQDEYAVDQFRQNFAEYGQQVLDHWHALAVSRAIDAQPPKPRRRMQRQERSGTMADASKEG